MAELQIGDKVKYKFGGKTSKGVIYGVRKVDAIGGTRVLSYLIDTGETLHIHSGVNEKGKIEETRQPHTLDIPPDDAEAI